MHDCCSTPGLLGVDEALGRLLAAARAPTTTARVPLALALGRVLAEPVRAAVNVPGHDNSAMDGYAVRLADLSAGRQLPVGPVVPAGSVPVGLPPGQAARIFTGAPIPAGADAVVMQEQCELDHGQVRLPEQIQPGQNIRRAGEDVAAGSQLLAAGVRLRPQELGLAASVGAAELVVYRRLKVALLTTGDELVEPGQPLAPGKIYDSNGPTLSALLEELGCDVLGPVHLPDQRQATVEALREAGAAADLIITCGGVSVGDEDHVKPAVEALGRLDMWRIAIKPGKPFAFGFVGDTPFLGLPGNPVSVFITFLLLARPFIFKHQGRAESETPALPVKAGFDWPRPDRKRREYLRARLAARDGELVAEIYPHQGSGVLSSCVWAEGLVRLEPGQTVTAGQPVPYLGLAELLR